VQKPRSTNGKQKLLSPHCKKTLKKVEKGLDKQDKVCYNKYVRGTGTLYKIKMGGDRHQVPMAQKGIYYVYYQHC
jgi:hypothetical protein